MAALGIALAGCSKGAPPAPAMLTAAAPGGTAVTAVTASSASAAPVVEKPAACSSPEAVGVLLFTSPRMPRPGEPLRVMAVSERPLAGAAVSIAKGDAELAGSREAHGGPPFFWSAEIPAAEAGSYRVSLRSAKASACAEVAVEASSSFVKARAWTVAWPVRASWNAGTEALYSAWIEKLFDAPLGEQVAVPALHVMLRDPKRNLLHDYLGEGEDDAGDHAIKIQPDCADLPYFLRAYFAHKLGLPFGYSHCTRGGPTRAPECGQWFHNLEAVPQRGSEADTFGDFLRVRLADVVHSGTGRTPAEGDEGDYYPVPLSFASLRPGTIYADPYGHVLVVAKRIAQTEESGGILLAVDGQPDGTVSRRRFWRGNFLFAADTGIGSPGFKRFRPVVQAGHRLHSMTNAEIQAAPGYGDYSLDQYGGGVEGFYDKMDDVLSPAPMDPARALREAILALEEQVKGRVLSVKNGDDHFAKDPKRIDMPEGASIFETAGPWEDFSTPSRDLRLLIAIDVVRGFADRVARRPERFAMPLGKGVAEVKGELERLLEGELASRRFSYVRSDGASQELSLADVVARAAALEVAYNPNDCPETRWGAMLGSDEAKSCRRWAPGKQTGRMRRYRAWFHERRRPPRGT